MDQRILKRDLILLKILMAIFIDRFSKANKH
jgi:hypothetical protein